MATKTQYFEMFFYFILFASSKWWNFTDADFYVHMQEESKLLPIFSLFTNSSSSNSIISLFKNFSHHFQSQHQIDFTHIDCLKTDFCTTQAQILEFPSIYIIQGPDYFYWKKIKTDNWTYEINNIMTLDNTLFEIKNDELTNSLDLPKRGGSLFQLTIQYQFKAVYRQFYKFIKYYKIFNSSFICSYDENIQAATITCYYSRNCFNRRRIRPIEVETYFEDNKFSFYHIYNQKELRDFIETSPFAFVIFQNHEQMIDSQEKVYGRFNSQCNKFKFGFIDSSMNKYFMKTFSIENLSQPFIFAINIFKDCYSTFEIDANDTAYNNVYDGINCQRIGRKFNLIPRKPKTTFAMLSFVLTFAFVFAFFYCIATSKRDDPFLEHQYNHESEFSYDEEEENSVQHEKHLKID